MDVRDPLSEKSREDFTKVSLQDTEKKKHMEKGGIVQCQPLGFCMFLLSTSLYCNIFSNALEFHRGHVSPTAGSSATLHYFELYTMKLSL